MIAKHKESKAIKRVWDWKDQIYNEVKDLPLEEMINKITDMASKAGKNWKPSKLNSHEQGIQHCV